MSKYLYIFDPGHGGLINGQYVTPGKRSPKFEDGSVLYEGVNNRDNVNRIMNELHKLGIDCIDIVNSNVDISLTERVNRANKLHPNRKCIYISIHSDANGDGKEWDQASGISVYTSPGQTKSDVFASLWIDELEFQFGETVKWRKDKTDGDEDKEAHFYVLKETNMPAVLGELGFHTNKEQAKRMLTDEWKNKVVASLVNAIQKWEKL
jgi:N-acetylmuramoyl-L-alanine amidase